MLNKLKLHLVPVGQEPTIPAMLGITDRLPHLKMIIELLGKRPKGTFIDDYNFLRTEAENEEELAYMSMQYFINVGANMGIQARITQKN